MALSVVLVHRDTLRDVRRLSGLLRVQATVPEHAVAEAVRKVLLDRFGDAARGIILRPLRKFGKFVRKARRPLIVGIVSTVFFDECSPEERSSTMNLPSSSPTRLHMLSGCP